MKNYFIGYMYFEKEVLFGAGNLSIKADKIILEDLRYIISKKTGKETAIIISINQI